MPAPRTASQAPRRSRLRMTYRLQILLQRLTAGRRRAVRCGPRGMHGKAPKYGRKHATLLWGPARTSRSVTQV